MLTARTRRAVDIDLQILVLDLHVHFVRLGQHCHRRRAGVDAPAAFGHRHALHAVDAAFELQPGKHAIAGHLRDDFLEAAHF